VPGAPHDGVDVAVEPAVDGVGATCGERAARGTLRRQIAHLEAELSRLVVRSFEMRGSAREARPVPASTGGEARLLDLGELERVRDDLARRLRAAEAAVEELAGRQAAARKAAV
jgi:hypothetical protein